MSQLNEAETLTKLKTLIAEHDLTYSYSDDHTAYQKGSEEYAQIIELSSQLNETEVNKIWNHWVDKKISKQFRNDWYWGSATEPNPEYNMKCNECGYEWDIMQNDDGYCPNCLSKNYGEVK